MAHGQPDGVMQRQLRVDKVLVLPGDMLSMHTGRKHDFLGVYMEFNEDGTLDVYMINYLNDFPEVIMGRVATPAANHLFEI